MGVRLKEDNYKFVFYLPKKNKKKTETNKNKVTLSHAGFVDQKSTNDLNAEKKAESDSYFHKYLDPLFYAHKWDQLILKIK